MGSAILPLTAIGGAQRFPRVIFHASELSQPALMPLGCPKAVVFWLLVDGVLLGHWGLAVQAHEDLRLSDTADATIAQRAVLLMRTHDVATMQTHDHISNHPWRCVLRSFALSLRVLR